MGLLLVTPESCKTFLDYPCEGTLVSRSRLCVLCPSSFATSADLWDSWAAIGICCFVKGTQLRVGDVSGGSKACATELVRHTSQIGFGAKTQESTKSEHGVHSRSLTSVTSSTEREKKIFRRGWREKLRWIQECCEEDPIF